LAWLGSFIIFIFFVIHDKTFIVTALELTFFSKALISSNHDLPSSLKMLSLSV